METWSADSLKAARPRESRLLARAALWAAEQPGVIGPVLAAYRREHRLDEHALAAQLRCSLNALHAIALCRQPSVAATSFNADVAALASYVGCDAEQLGRVLREQAGAEVSG